MASASFADYTQTNYVRQYPTWDGFKFPDEDKSKKQVLTLSEAKLKLKELNQFLKRWSKPEFINEERLINFFISPIEKNIVKSLVSEVLSSGNEEYFSYLKPFSKFEIIAITFRIQEDSTDDFEEIYTDVYVVSNDIDYYFSNSEYYL